MSESPLVIIRQAAWPADEAAAIHLLRNYAAHLASNPAGAANICLTGYDAELATLPTRWSHPNGALLLAYCDHAPAGCVAIKIRGDRPGTTEMKRLWVEPTARGCGVGKRLARASIDWSRDHGYETLLLDTVPEAMPEAAALYRALGFTETDRHNDNPVPGLAFFELSLR